MLKQHREAAHGRRHGTGAVVTLLEEQPWAPAWFGNCAREVVGPEQTGGRLAVLELDEAQDPVSVVHSHEDADEALDILAGTLSAFLDRQRWDVGPGA